MKGVVLFLAFVSLSYCVDNGLGLFPPMGWNTWCTLGSCGRDYCDDAEIRSIADTMVSNGMKDLGYEYVNLDDCWADKRDANGNILPDPNRFPHGMKAVADYVHSKGLKFGLYTCAGTYTCSSGGRDHKIPGSYGHYEQDANTYASWGIDYVKMDWCNTNGLKPEIQYPQMSIALNKTGRPMFFTMCEWGVDQPWKWGANVSNMWRSTGDHHDNWGSTSKIIEALAGLSPYSGKGHWNYMDFLMTGGEGCKNNDTGHCPGQTNTEYISEFSFWAFINSGLIVATDIREMTPIMQQVLFNKEVIALNKDPLRKQGDRTYKDSCGEKTSNACQVWARDLSGGNKAALLYNAGENAHEITLDFCRDLKWCNGESADATDLWSHKDLGTVSKTWTSPSIPSHGVVLLKLTAK